VAFTRSLEVSTRMNIFPPLHMEKRRIHLGEVAAEKSKVSDRLPIETLRRAVRTFFAVRAHLHSQALCG